MAIFAPVILLPTGGADYTTDVPIQTLSGTTDSNTGRIEVNGSTHGVSYSEGETVWSWTGSIELGQNTINVRAIEKDTLLVSDPAIIKITLIESNDFITVSPPTGVRLRRYQDKVEIITSKNPEVQVVGYNFYVYPTSGGLNNEYAKINTELVTEPTFYEDSEKELGRQVETSGTIRVTTITDEILRSDYYSVFLDDDRFTEMVEDGLLPDVPFNDETPLYFVITAVIYDPSSGELTESTYSFELEGSPLTITTGITDLPGRSQSDIILTYSRELLLSDPGIDTKPGTVLRDVIDPISEEQARVYIIQDFMARSLSVTGLLEFDDENGDGESDAVANSVNKRALQVALNLTDPNDVQTLIDEQFDKLGSNVNVRRQGAVPASGSVIFYTETPPIRDMTVLEGALVATTGDLDTGVASQSYITLASKTLDVANRESYYNSVTQRYELEIDIEAVDSGENGNTDSYTIETVTSGSDSDFRVENPNPISFGQDIQSNRDLATDILLAFFTDTGTEGGYARVSVAVPRVRNVRVEKAKDPLMRRDWDPLREEHIGGKVDIYVEGSLTRQMSDQIAFSFDSVQQSEGTQEGERFNVINAAAFQFQSTNPNVTAHTPIFDVTKVTNATKGQDYDISGYQIIGDGDTVDLDESLPRNAAIGLSSTDIIRVDYKYRSSDVFILEHQPVDEVISVVGQLSGELTTDNWDLVKLQDPLEEGNSTIARDGVRIKFANNLPLTEFQTIEDEEHVMILETNEELNFLGVDPDSIVVKNKAKTVTYAENIDYTVNQGTSTEPSSIRMLESGSILNGQTVLVSYTAIENFTITYTTNALLDQVQEEVDEMKHACADVIVKQAIKNDVDLVITVIPKAGVTNLTRLTSQIKTTVGNYVSQLGIGRALTQSEVVHQINRVDEVDYVVIPFIRMAKADGSFIVRDDVGKPQFEIFNEGVVTSYITTASVLSYNTVDQGGSEDLFRGIFEDNMPLVLQEDVLDVSGGAGRGYIQSDGRIVVSTRDGDLPDTKGYEVAYYVKGETGSNDINVNSVEYLDIGSFSITYDSPRDLSKQAF